MYYAGVSALMQEIINMYYASVLSVENILVLLWHHHVSNNDKYL